MFTSIGQQAVDLKYECLGDPANSPGNHNFTSETVSTLVRFTASQRFNGEVQLNR